MSSQKIKQHVKEELLKAIVADEKEYCFDKSYCSDEHWIIENPNETREQAFNRVIQEFSNMSIEQIVEFFGDKYDYLLDTVSGKGK